MRCIRVALVAVLFVPGMAHAQARPQLSAAVRAFVREDAAVIVLQHARVIDGTGAPARENQTVVVAEGVIAAIGDSGRTALPPGARLIDSTGYTLIPGLVGMHNHMFFPAPSGEPALYPVHATSFPRLYLAAGVTTIRTTGSVEPSTDLAIKKLIDAGRMAGPKLHVTGPYLQGPALHTPQMHQLADAAEARRIVEFWIAQGVTSFKVYTHITPEELAAALQAAPRRRAHAPAGHGQGTPASGLEPIAGGVHRVRSAERHDPGEPYACPAVLEAVPREEPQERYGHREASLTSNVCERTSA